jgi:hypothetical protein
LPKTPAAPRLKANSSRRDIKRYKAEFADLLLINSHNGIKDKGIKRIDVVNDYPAIYNHLKQYEKELLNGKIKETTGLFKKLCLSRRI